MPAPAMKLGGKLHCFGKEEVKDLVSIFNVHKNGNVRKSFKEVANMADNEQQTKAGQIKPSKKKKTDLSKRQLQDDSLSGGQSNKTDFKRVKEPVLNDSDTDDEDEDDGSSSSDVDDSDSDDGGNEEGKSSEQDSEEEVNVEFEAQGLCEDDFHGICQLLKQSLVTTHVNVSELTDLLLAQRNIGSTIKVVDDEENVVYGISSVISLSEHKEKTCVKQIKDFVAKTCTSQGDDQAEVFSDIFQKSSVGLLINERFINIPPQIALPLYETLRSEIKDLSDQDNSYKFDYYMLFCKSLMYADDGSIPVKKKKKKKKTSNCIDENQLIFVNQEDEVFMQNAKLSFSYSVTDAIGNALGGDWAKDDTMDTYRTVIVIEESRLDSIIDALKISLGS